MQTALRAVPLLYFTAVVCVPGFHPWNFESRPCLVLYWMRWLSAQSSLQTLWTGRIQVTSLASAAERGYSPFGTRRRLFTMLLRGPRLIWLVVANSESWARNLSTCRKGRNQAFTCLASQGCRPTVRTLLITRYITSFGSVRKWKITSVKAENCCEVNNTEHQ